MCKGDDPSCADFEVHHRQFVEDMARERRAFLNSRFAGKGGLAVSAWSLATSSCRRSSCCSWLAIGARRWGGRQR